MQLLQTDLYMSKAHLHPVHHYLVRYNLHCPKFFVEYSRMIYSVVCVISNDSLVVGQQNAQSHEKQPNLTDIVNSIDKKK